MYKVLIVEDEKAIADMLKAYLNKEGYEVFLANEGLTGIALYNINQPHLVVLDRMLPDLSGDQVCLEIRKISKVPIMMLTAKADEESRIEGFELGVDDYVTKPFSTREVVYRIKALLKRTYPQQVKVMDYDDGYLAIDLSGGNIYRAQEHQSLTSNEMAILKTFLDHKGQVLTRDQLAEYAFGIDYEAFDRNIDTYIKNIRQKIEEQPKSPKYIITKYGLGYYFEKK